MANDNHKMKTILISIAIFSLLLISDGFNLNKLGRGSRYSRDFQQVNEANELNREIFLGDILLGHRQDGIKNRLSISGKLGLTKMSWEFRIVDRNYRLGNCHLNLDNCISLFSGSRALWPEVRRCKAKHNQQSGYSEGQADEGDGKE